MILTWLSLCQPYEGLQSKDLLLEDSCICQALARHWYHHLVQSLLGVPWEEYAFSYCCFAQSFPRHCAGKSMTLIQKLKQTLLKLTAGSCQLTSLGSRFFHKQESEQCISMPATVHLLYYAHEKYKAAPPGLRWASIPKGKLRIGKLAGWTTTSLLQVGLSITTGTHCLQIPLSF